MATACRDCRALSRWTAGYARLGLLCHNGTRDLWDTPVDSFAPQLRHRRECLMRAGTSTRSWRAGRDGGGGAARVTVVDATGVVIYQSRDGRDGRILGDVGAGWHQQSGHRLLGRTGAAALPVIVAVPASRLLPSRVRQGGRVQGIQGARSGETPGEDPRGGEEAPAPHCQAILRANQGVHGAGRFRPRAGGDAREYAAASKKLETPAPRVSGHVRGERPARP